VGFFFKAHYAKRYSGEQERAAKKTIPIYIVGNIGLYYLCTSIKIKP
jgi:Zn-finger domain-containing protein